MTPPPCAWGANPAAVAVNPATNKIYGANNGSTALAGWCHAGTRFTVTVIDGVTNHKHHRARGSQPAAMVVNPATNKIYGANNGSITVAVSHWQPRWL
jgi:DNA-binding beta-propeller fold protein YncE